MGQETSSYPKEALNKRLREVRDYVVEEAKEEIRAG